MTPRDVIIAILGLSLVSPILGVAIPLNGRDMTMLHRIEHHALTIEALVGLSSLIGKTHRIEHHDLSNEALNGPRINDITERQEEIKHHSFTTENLDIPSSSIEDATQPHRMQHHDLSDEALNGPYPYVGDSHRIEHHDLSREALEGPTTSMRTLLARRPGGRYA